MSCEGEVTKLISQSRRKKLFLFFLGPLGVIEFTVNFIKDVRRLDVKIHNAKVNAGSLNLYLMFFS